MKTSFNALRLVLPILCSGLLLTACGSDDEKDNNSNAGDGTVTWTHAGKTYTSTVYSSAVVDSPTKIIIAGSSSDLNNAVTIGLEGIDKGPGVYELRKGSVLDDLPAAAITLNGTGSQGTMFNTLYGPSTANGTVTVSQYDKAGQRISGTFTFTAGAVPNTSASGTQNVTNGSFSFTKFR